MKKNCPPNVPKKTSSYFYRIYRLIRLFYVKKLRDFIESGACSKSTKLIFQTTSNVWVVMQKNGPPNVPKKQVRISNGIIDLFAYSILKKHRNFIKSGGCSKSTKLISQTNSNVWAVMKINCPPNVPKKTSSYFNRIYRLIRLFYFKKCRNFIESGG